MLGWGAVLTVPMGLVFGRGLASASPVLVFLTLAAALFIMGLTYGPLGSWLPALFPVALRYSGISVAFNVGGIIGGALTPFAAKMWADSGHGESVGLLLSLAGVLTLLGIAISSKASPLGPNAAGSWRAMQRDFQGSSD